jgi:hypothetical protein
LMNSMSSQFTLRGLSSTGIAPWNARRRAGGRCRLRSALGDPDGTGGKGERRRGVSYSK